jgi:hypothetical protein
LYYYDLCRKITKKTVVCIEEYIFSKVLIHSRSRKYLVVHVVEMIMNECVHITLTHRFLSSVIL